MPTVRSLPGDRYGIVVSSYHRDITQRLLAGAVDVLRRQGVEIQTVWAPGAFELPILADRMARTGKFVAVIILGAVIQGETDHHDYINHAVAQGITHSSQNTGVPILFGLLTCRNMDQAHQRAGGSAGNKGAEAAQAALETVAGLREIDEAK